MKQRSFRTRILLGTALWSLGILTLAHIATTVLVFRYPGWLPAAHFTIISALAIGFVVAGFSTMRRGMSPFTELRARLAAVRDGQAPRVEGSYPNEVQPLVNDLNALLDHRELAVRRAQAKAGDLAHGLKTPLAILAQEAERAASAGQVEIAGAIAQQVERMRRQVDYHLAHARAAASGSGPGSRCSAKESADGLARTLLRLHADRGLDIQVNIAAGHSVRVQLEDLDEMLGNLLDNACKWAKSTIMVESSEVNGSIVIQVDDDGAGLDPQMREAVLQRGVRADEAAPGSGFGLAIVRDLAELYGGSISLGDSPSGGLRARLELPTR